jgi:methionine synthase I (cobalamin-dependent)
MLSKRVVTSTSGRSTAGTPRPRTACRSSTGTRVRRRPPPFDAVARGLLDAGARVIGGCCRTTPADVAAIARAVRAATLTDAAR